MKAFLSILILLISTQLSIGQNEFDLGNKAYLDANYANAIQYFEKAIEEDPQNTSAYYNLGMAHQQNKSFGKAIWAFEKALKLDPTDDEAEEQIMQCFIELKGSEYEWSSSVGPFEKLVYGFGSFIWSVLSIIFSVLLAIIIIYRVYRSEMNRNYFAFLSVGTGILLIMMIFFAKITYNFESDHAYGIITKHTVVTKLDENAGNDGPALTEGSRLKVIGQTKSGFYKVVDSNKNTFLINQEDLDLI